MVLRNQTVYFTIVIFYTYVLYLHVSFLTMYTIYILKPYFYNPRYKGVFFFFKYHFKGQRICSIKCLSSCSLFCLSRQKYNSIKCDKLKSYNTIRLLNVNIVIKKSGLSIAGHPVVKMNSYKCPRRLFLNSLHVQCTSTKTIQLWNYLTSLIIKNVA